MSHYDDQYNFCVTSVIKYNDYVHYFKSTKRRIENFKVVAPRYSHRLRMANDPPERPVPRPPVLPMCTSSISGTLSVLGSINIV